MEHRPTLLGLVLGSPIGGSPRTGGLGPGRRGRRTHVHRHRRASRRADGCRRGWTLPPEHGLQGDQREQPRETGRDPEHASGAHLRVADHTAGRGRRRQHDLGLGIGGNVGGRLHRSQLGAGLVDEHADGLLRPLGRGRRGTELDDRAQLGDCAVVTAESGGRVGAIAADRDDLVAHGVGVQLRADHERELGDAVVQPGERVVGAGRSVGRCGAGRHDEHRGAALVGVGRAVEAEVGTSGGQSQDHQQCQGSLQQGPQQFVDTHGNPPFAGTLEV